MNTPLLNKQDLQTLLDEGLGGYWRDAAGNSLLHHAARLGDDKMAGACIAQGASALVYNADSESARDVARIWGHDALAQQLDEQMRKEKTAKPPAPIAYSSLNDIRTKSSETGINIFHTLARQGLFDQVIALAQTGSNALTTADLLGKTSDGTTVLFEICQQGQLSLLLKPELWVKNMDVFTAMWEKIPYIYRQEIHLRNFINSVNQLKLASKSSQRPGWKSPH